MSLFLNNDNNTVSIRKGDSGVLRFVFDHPMNGVYVTFSVKENKYDSDDEAVIVKSYLCGYDKTISPYEAYFFIKPEDTAELEIYPQKEKWDFQDYYWMLKIETNRGILADTVIPTSTNTFPKFRVYYGSVPDEDMDNTHGLIG